MVAMGWVEVEALFYIHRGSLSAPQATSTEIATLEKAYHVTRPRRQLSSPINVFMAVLLPSPQRSPFPGTCDNQMMDGGGGMSSINIH